MITNKLLFVCLKCKLPVKSYWAWAFRAFGVVICTDCTDDTLWVMGSHERDPKKVYRK